MRVRTSTTTRTNIQNSGEEIINITEVNLTGATQFRSLTKDDFVESLQDLKLPLRDLRMLVKSAESGRTKHFTISPRPASKCFILDIEHVKLLCFRK